MPAGLCYAIYLIALGVRWFEKKFIAVWLLIDESLTKMKSKEIPIYVLEKSKIVFAQHGSNFYFALVCVAFFAEWATSFFLAKKKPCSFSGNLDEILSHMRFLICKVFTFFPLRSAQVKLGRSLKRIIIMKRDTVAQSYLKRTKVNSGHMTNLNN